MDTLKQCPFCGNDAHTTKHKEIECISPQCILHSDEFILFDTEVWNHRPVEDSLRKDKEYLAKKNQKLRKELADMTKKLELSQKEFNQLKRE